MSQDLTWWLVERDDSPTNAPAYLQATRSSAIGWIWTADPLEATRFVRRDDAASIVKAFFPDRAHRVAEHSLVVA